MVWFGWEMDIRPGMSRIGMPPIVAHNHDGSAITGIVRSEIITPVPATSVPISLTRISEREIVGRIEMIGLLAPCA